MMRHLWILLLSALCLRAGTEGPAGFYIVSRSFSDAGALYYTRVLDVHADGPDTTVRYIRVGWSNWTCPSKIVQAAVKRIPNTTPAELAAKGNPCAIDPRAYRSTLKQYRQRASVLEAFSEGIVATCGSSVVSFEVPFLESVSMDRMKPAHPDFLNLWNLMSDVETSVFGPNDIFQNRAESDDLELQRIGEEFLPDLRSGRYDPGLNLAVKGNVGRWRSPAFRALLQDYRGPVSASAAKPVPQLRNREAYHFALYQAPLYPPLAQAARIGGDVELQLTLNPSTGEVTHATSISGHPLLAPSAVSAAEKWRFTPDASNADKIKIILSYELHCP